MASMLQRVASSGVVPASCALLGDSTRSEYGFSLPQNLAAPHGSSSWGLKGKLGLRWGDSLGFRPLPSSFFSAVHPSFERTQQPSRTPLIISMVLPTGSNSERIVGRGNPAWEARAVKSYSMAELEARKLKYSTTGTEALVMGILTEGTSAAAKFLRKNGITLFGIRDETVKLLGKADMYFFSPEHPPLTQPAQDALDWALDEKSRLGIDGEVSTTLLLLGIWAQKGSAGQTILSSLGFDDKMATELTASLKKEKEMVSAASS
ncbi:hypothetical protein BDL97_12G109600 [Sphagnum fallax]|nr:hypothetical protein BDL97_12G109600 [Sphagnum fallax]